MLAPTADLYMRDERLGALGVAVGEDQSDGGGGTHDDGANDGDDDEDDDEDRMNVDCAIISAVDIKPLDDRRRPSSTTALSLLPVALLLAGGVGMSAGRARGGGGADLPATV